MLSHASKRQLSLSSNLFLLSICFISYAFTTFFLYTFLFSDSLLIILFLFLLWNSVHVTFLLFWWCGVCCSEQKSVYGIAALSSGIQYVNKSNKLLIIKHRYLLSTVISTVLLYRHWYPCLNFNKFHSSCQTLETPAQCLLARNCSCWLLIYPKLKPAGTASE